jgi:hypothetical protein
VAGYTAAPSILQEGLRSTSSWIAPPHPQHPHRQIKLCDSASGVPQFETHPRQHVEDDANRQNEPRCNTEECSDENLTRQYQGEPSAVERWHRLARGRETQEQSRKAGGR